MFPTLDATEKNETVVDQNVAPSHFLQHKIYLDM